MKNIYEEIHFNNERYFPFKIHYSDEKTFIHNLPIHFHKEMEILYFKEGGVIYEINNIPYKVESESIIIFPSNSYHKGTVFNYEKHISLIYIFNLSILGLSEILSIKKYLEPIVNNEIIYPVIIDSKIEGFEILKNILLNLWDIYEEKKDFFELKIKIELLKFFLSMYKMNILLKKNKEYSNKKQKKASQIFSYIHENYKENLQREDLIKNIEISESQFTRFFKEISGKTFTEYLSYYRIIKSKYYLIYTEKSITEIAYEIGFQDLSYFIKVFNKYEKISPNKYRKKYK